MLINRFATLSRFNFELINISTFTKLARTYGCKSPTLFQDKPAFQFVSMKNLAIPSSCPFSTSKKVPKSPQKSIYRLKKTDMKTDQSGQKYFLLYNGQKQQKSFQIVTGLFVLIFGLSLVKLYYTESEYRKDDYIILFVVIGSFVVYQRRILKTLKKVALNSKGDKLFITTFNILAKGQRVVQAPVNIMTGFTKATRLGGYILRGGGKTSGLKEMKFWFSKQYITDQATFEHVGKGKCPKIVDQYQTL